VKYYLYRYIVIVTMYLYNAIPESCKKVYHLCYTSVWQIIGLLPMSIRLRVRNIARTKGLNLSQLQRRADRSMTTARRLWFSMGMDMNRVHHSSTFI
jgi:hypothetical protein